MSSFLEGRRHTTDHTGHPLTSNNTPAASRSSSVASNRSQPSTPSWYSAYNGTDTSKVRNDSTSRPNLSPRNSSKKLEQKPGTTATSGWKALFGSDKSDDRKEKKKQKQKDVDKIVLTSRHAAAVKTRLAVDPKYAEERRRSSASEASTGPINGGTPTSHLTAAEQEMRFPHSGPPSRHTGKTTFHRKGKKGADVDMDLPILTRIASGDERDEEGERQREEWVRNRNDAAMRRFTMAEGMEEGSEGGGVSRQGSWDDTELTPEMADGKVMKVEGTHFIGVELEGDAYTPRAKPKGSWSLPLDDANPYNNGANGPSDQVPFDDNVWPRSINQPVQGFLNHHFQDIDDSSGSDPTANDKNCDTFAALFTSDATYNFNGQLSTGTAAIKQTCLAIFKQIPYRKHYLTHAYSFGRDDKEVVLTGSVSYGMKSVDEKSREWTEIFGLTQDDGDIKIKSERVWVDPGS